MGHHCLSNTEKIRLILNKLPMTLSVQEIGDISGYHRNTVRNILSNLAAKKQVYQTGTHRTRNFYANRINQFYRKMAKALPNKAVAQHLGYDFVHNLLNESVNPKNVHQARKDPKEFQELLSLAFPFIEYNYDTDGSIKPITSIELQKVEQTQFTTFKAKVSPCLCNGEDESGKSCSMVQGTLKATTDFVYNVNSFVRWIDHSPGELPSCNFLIKIPIQQNNKNTMKEPLKLDEY
ncbi:MAG: hypothetical protein D6732_14055 [Methanobacteriota archaeon]|nr:MAG: hypothetical protein D6732_14055 [Euryarchaeota archaeon]